MIVVVLGAVIGVLAVALAVAVGVIYFVLKEAHRNESELLDRVMSRDFTEFKAMSKVGPLRRSSMNDEREAQIEKERANA